MHIHICVIMIQEFHKYSRMHIICNFTNMVAIQSKVGRHQFPADEGMGSIWSGFNDCCLYIPNV